jgi:GT2 family glycosyltransferase
VYTPQISVIVTNYNGEHHLRDCFSSLQRLDYPRERFEVVMVDDASRDNSVEYARKHFPEVRVVVNPRNLRYTRTVNVGVEATESPFMAFLNNDTRVEPGWLAELIRPFESDPTCAATSAKMLEWDGSRVNFNGGYLNFEGRGFEVCCDLGANEEITEDTPVLFACGGGMVTRRDVYEVSGGFDGDFRMTYEDVDYGWRLNLLGYRVLFCPRALMYHRSHGWLSTVDYPLRAPFLDRNACQMLIKNLSAENLPRILAGALLMSWRRSKAFQDQPLHEFWTSGGSVRRKLAGLLRRILKKIDPRLDVNSTDLRAHNDAMNALLEELPRLIPKREWIQSHRVVSDEEILRRFFPDPFRTWAMNEEHLRYLAHAGYSETMELVAGILNLSDLFGRREP